MKKIKLIFFILISVSLLTGASIFLMKKFFPKNKIFSKTLDTEFSTNSSIDIDKHHYDCEFSHHIGDTKIKIKNPKSIEGLCIEWSNGKQKISMGDLSKNLENLSFPENSFLNLIVKILDSIPSMDLSESKDDGRYQTFIGNLENNEFEVCAEKSKILEINVKSKNAKISFE